MFNNSRNSTKHSNVRVSRNNLTTEEITIITSALTEIFSSRNVPLIKHESLSTMFIGFLDRTIEISNTITLAQFLEHKEDPNALIMDRIIREMGYDPDGEQAKSIYKDIFKIPLVNEVMQYFSSKIRALFSANNNPISLKLSR